MFKKVITFVVINAFMFAGMASLSKSLSDDSFTRGLALKEQGHWQAALEIWQTASDSMKEVGSSDSRIGFGFIQLATEKQATQFYDRASQIYFWGLSQDQVDSRYETLRRELERIFPLLDEKEREEWQQLFDANYVRLFSKIKTFWTKRDPIPTTEINERLIEHWERVAYVKENYTLENSTAYGTDDRGLVFMKYGAPDVKYTGKLGTDQLEIMRWFDSFRIRQEIQRYNTVPECEIWVYRRLTGDKSAVFLFGKKAGFGKYGLRYGVEELITDRAFRRSSTQTTRGVLPGAMLQLMYYWDLIQIDHHFLERYRELETLWTNARAGGRLAPNYDSIRGKVSDYKSRDLNNIRFKYLPQDRTDTLEGLEPIALKYRPFRYLDNEKIPRFSLMVASSDEGPHGLDFTPFFRQERMSKYKIRHVLVAYDDEWNIVDRIVDYPAINNINTSTFRVVQESGRVYSVVSEKVFFDSRRVQLEESDIPDTAKVMGVGSRFVGKIVPLSTDSSGFEVSDLLLGAASSLSPDLYPFPVIPKDPVTSAQPLLAYFELYPGTLASERGAEFHMEYKIKRVENGRAKERKKRALEKGRLQAGESKLAKTFQIDLQDMEAGDYECVLLLKVSGLQAQKERTSYFKIID
ncbi:GWxTD domain-containing protein [bacterium]|nr:GWxTD domain-containing protein [bacterium]